MNTRPNETDALTEASRPSPAPAPEHPEAQTGSLHVLLHAAEIAVLLVPVYFLAYLAGCFGSSELTAVVILLLPAVVSGGLTASLTRSERVLQALVKILLSFPVTVGLWFWMRDAQMLLRALNWGYPGYGELSAGGGFAALFQLCILAAGHILGMLTGIAVTREKSNAGIWKPVRFAAHIICAGTMAAFLVLCFLMPEYAGVTG